jgi:oligosaccharyltransferase complex subunit alpha (ribophorin I)
MMWNPSRIRLFAVSLLSLSSLAVASPYNVSAKALPATFSPPQVFENSNLVRTLNLERSYARDTVNVVVKNIADSPQNEYYYAIPREHITRVGGFEARDKKASDQTPFAVQLVKTDTEL